jgi:hypothetical protein
MLTLRGSTTFNSFEKRTDENAELNRISKKIGYIQCMDFRKLKNKDLDSEVVQDFLDKIASELA